MASIEFHKAQIEDAVQAAIEDGCHVEIGIGCCGYGALHIWKDGEPETLTHIGCCE